MSALTDAKPLLGQKAKRVLGNLRRIPASDGCEVLGAERLHAERHEGDAARVQLAHHGFVDVRGVGLDADVARHLEALANALEHRGDALQRERRRSAPHVDAGDFGTARSGRPTVRPPLSRRACTAPRARAGTGPWCRDSTDSSSGRTERAGRVTCARAAEPSSERPGARTPSAARGRQGGGAGSSWRAEKARCPGRSPVPPHREHGARPKPERLDDLGAGGVAAVLAALVGRSAARPTRHRCRPPRQSACAAPTLPDCSASSPAREFRTGSPARIAPRSLSITGARSSASR